MALLAIAAAIGALVPSMRSDVEPAGQAPELPAAEVDVGHIDLELDRGPARSIAAPIDARESPDAITEPARTPPTARFSGRVVADESGAPIAEARVGELDARDEASVASDADGRFAWISAQLGEELAVRSPGRAPRLVSARAGHEEPARAVEVRLQLGASVDARIRGGRAHAGLQLVASVERVVLHDIADARAHGPDVELARAFDSDGRALLADLPARASLSLEVRDPASRTILGAFVLEPGETRVVDVDLGARARLAVRLVDQNGIPVRARDLLLLRDPVQGSERAAACYLDFDDATRSLARRRTDDSGLAVFEDVASGAWWCGPAMEEPRATRDDVAAVARRIEVPAQAREHDVTLRADRGLHLRGRIVDASGNPVRRAYVGCEHVELGGHVTGDVGDDGRFELGPVAAGTHRVVAIPLGVFLASEPQLAEPDGTPLVFTLERGGELAGVVVDAATGRGARADYACSLLGGDLVTHGSLGDDGAFAIDGLGRGTYAIVARTSDGRAGVLAPVEVEIGRARSDLRVELSPAARVAVHYVGGPERATCMLRVDGAAIVVEDLVRGVRRDLFVPAGRVRASLEHGATRPSIREADATPGRPVELSFALE